MKIILIVLFACAVTLINSVSVCSSRQEGFLNKANPQVKTRLIDQTTALQIARKNAEQTYGSVDGYNTLACEQGLLWRVYLEPPNATDDFSGLEYVISKLGGRVLRQRKLPAAEDNQDLSTTAKIDRKEAITIAEKDGKKAYGSLVRYQMMICELRSVWIVVFSPEEKMDGGGPEYIIDKRHGSILDKRYYQ